MKGELRYCTTDDGVSIAYTMVGAGPPLIWVRNWMSDVRTDLDNPIWTWTVRKFAERLTVVLYDQRGTGESDLEVADLSFDGCLSDLDAVRAACGFERVSLFSYSQTGPLAVTYAVRCPERVDRIVFWNTCARGRHHEEDVGQAGDLVTNLLRSIREGSGRQDPVLRRLYSRAYVPDATPEQEAWFNQFQIHGTSTENGARLFLAVSRSDATDLLPLVSAEVLVVHVEDDGVNRSEEGRVIASRIPGARFLTLAGRNHIVLEQDREAQRGMEEAARFLAREPAPPAAQTGDSTITPPPTEQRSFASGRYVVRRPLGAGGQKIVFLAHDTVLDRDCALSLVKSEFLEEEDIRRLRREAQAMARLGAHANIVTVYDFGDEAGHAFLVCEYVPGGDLRRQLTGGHPMRLDRALAIAENVAQALHVAHARGVIHRDIKPANIWLDEEGTAKLGDFGLAFINRSRLTADGAILGTAAYMAPEQALGQPATSKSDLYAVGALLYELTTGRPPFVGEDSMAIISQHIHAVPAPPSTFAAVLPPALDALILELLAKQPEERPESADTVLIELREIKRRLD